jgi:hypothetical protein
VSSVLVVLVLPVADRDPGVSQRPEQLDVEAFVAEPSVERLDVAVPPRLTGWDERQADSTVGPVSHRCAGELRAVVAAQHGWVTADGGEAVELVDELVGGDRALDQAAEALAVCSSTTETILTGRPSVVESNWKSTAHTVFGASAVGVSGAEEDPTRLRRRGCGTRSPSSRHSRWIFLWLTVQPSPRASW